MEGVRNKPVDDSTASAAFNTYQSVVSHRSPTPTSTRTPQFSLYTASSSEALRVWNLDCGRWIPTGSHPRYD